MGKTKIKTAVSSIVFLALILTVLPCAYAAQYRLQSEVTDTETVSYRYDSRGRLERKTVSYGGKDSDFTDFFYSGNVLTEKQFSFADDDFVLSFHYDSNGTQIELENPGMGGDLFWMKGDEHREIKDTDGRPAMVSVRSSTVGDRTLYYVFDSRGRINTFEISGFRRDEFTYSANGEYYRKSIYLYPSETRVTRITERYNADGQLTESIDQYGMLYCYTYDRNGNLAEITRDGEPEYNCRYEYDQNGNVSAMTKIYPGGYQTRTEYRYEKVS